MLTKKISRKILPLIYKITFKLRILGYGDLFGYKINSSIEGYRSLFNSVKNKKYTKIDEIEKSNGFKINKNWIDNLALHTQVVIKKSDINYSHGRLLYCFLRSYIKNSNSSSLSILETGTARGFSSLCMAKAIHDSNISGKIMTIDVIPHNYKMYWNCIDDFEGKKTRNELLSTWNSLLENIIFIHGDSTDELKRLGIKRINFAFLDAHHEYNNVIQEYKFLEEKQFSGDIIFFDDVTPTLFPGVVKAIDEIRTLDKYNLKIIKVSSERQFVLAIKK